jgi:hypothetical protein
LLRLRALVGLWEPNGFWKHGAFRDYLPIRDLEVPVVLDCGGFLAMRRYGGYRWTVTEYLDLAVMLRPLWWASMDWCRVSTKTKLANVSIIQQY